MPAPALPKLSQVADRWHLLRNLQDALKGTVDRHHADVRAAAQARVADKPEPLSGQASAAPQPAEQAAASVSPLRTERQQERRHRREQLYDEVLELHGQGLSRRTIADRLGVHRSTVQRFVAAGSFPERAGRRSARRTDRFGEYLKERWAAGCQNAMQLYAELQARGFDGSYYSVRRQLAQWRSAVPPSGEGPSHKRFPR